MYCCDVLNQRYSYAIFREAGLPVYSTIQDAVGAITGIRRWCAGTQEADKGLENRRVHAQ